MKHVVFDFEFVPGNPCLPISVALVDVSSQNSMYLEWPQAKERANANEWLAANVAPHLDPRSRFDEDQIEASIRSFLRVTERDHLTLYASYGAYDFFLLSETLGGFSRSGLPYTYVDMAHMGLPRVERLPGERDHNAMDDVRLLVRALRQHWGYSDSATCPTCATRSLLWEHACPRCGA